AKSFLLLFSPSARSSVLDIRKSCDKDMTLCVPKRDVTDKRRFARFVHVCGHTHMKASVPVSLTETKHVLASSVLWRVTTQEYEGLQAYFFWELFGTPLDVVPDTNEIISERRKTLDRDQAIGIRVGPFGSRFLDDFCGQALAVGQRVPN